MGNPDSDATTSTTRPTDTTPAPPAYSAAESSDPPAYTTSPPWRTQLHTLSGATLPISTSLHITSDNPALNQDRTLTLRPPSAVHPTYHATFSASLVDYRLKSMTIRRGNKANARVADLFFDGRNDMRAHLGGGAQQLVLHVRPAPDHVEHEHEDGEDDGEQEAAPAEGGKSATDRKAEAEVAAAQGRVSGAKKKANVRAKKQRDNQFHYVVEGLAGGECYWRSTAEYVHEVKGKGKGGDLEMVDARGEVLAVFVNNWDGSRMSYFLGELCVTEMGLREEVKDAVAVTLVAVLVRTVMGKMGWRVRALFDGLSSPSVGLALLVCNVM